MKFFLLLFVTSYYFITVLGKLKEFQYPDVRRDSSVSDDLFGTTVVDYYRWLEDPDSDETKKFVENQNAVTQPYVQSNPYRDSINQSFTELYNYPKYGVPAKRGSKYYFSSNTGLQDQSIIYSMDAIDSTPQLFLDPNSFSPDGTTSLVFTSFSKDGLYCAYGISKGGSDWRTIKIKDTQTGEDLQETLTKIKFSSTSWTLDNIGFFYSQYDEYNGTGEGTDPIVPQDQKLFYHKLNTDQSEDVMITKFPDHPLWLIGTPIVSDDGKYVHIFPSEGTSSTPWFYAALDGGPITNELTFTTITDKAEAEYYYVTSDDNFAYMRTNKNAPKFRLVKVDLNDPDESNWINILPEHDVAVLDGAIAVNQDYLAAIYMRDVVHIIEIHNLTNGKYLWDVDIPIGTVSGISGNRNGVDLFYQISSFLHPGIVYRYDFNSNPNTIRVFRESKISGLDTTEFETNQVFYRSKDGKVKVPMFIVNRRNIKLDGSNPTMLYAYGGFNINIQPAYDPLATFFINNLNGVYALANIRGGGEYGESWHEGGMLLNKQNVFDDFASAAEYLIENKYTRRDRLTINGRSNGGLLVGAASNQRPDLYGCALANVGVMDMIRFPLFTIGYAWTEEYGDPQKNETQFKYIYTYSPLHNIRSDATQYPAMLVLTADHDDRVVPAHSHKFISELQYQLGDKLPDIPLMIRVDTNSGHGSGKPTSKWIEEYTDIASFVINALKIDYTGPQKSTDV